MWSVLAVALLCTAVSYAEGNFNKNCTDLNFQRAVDISSLEGLWMGVEIITHAEEEKWYTKMDELEKNNSTCPIIRILDATHQVSTTIAPYGQGNYDKRQRQPAGRGGSQTWTQQDYYRLSEQNSWRYLELSWSDRNKTTWYCLKYKISAGGKWLSTSGCKQNGMNYDHNPFNGNIQVIAALRDYLILYFCELKTGSHKFSIVLSRPHQKLGTGVMHSIHKLLNSRNMPMLSIQEACNSVSGLRSGIISIITVLLLVTRNLNLH